MEICKKEKCTGCATCINICPKGCISFETDAFGFAYPQIDDSYCIHCNSCVKHCPQNIDTTKKTYNKKAYAVQNSNPIIVKKSASGGAFYSIAEQVLSEGGIVIGCTMDENLLVKHICVDTIEALDKLHGSKYVQSDVRAIYSDVCKYLSLGKRVLFSGTPCQVAGIYSFLQEKDTSKLITIDLVCHGVGSPLFFRRYTQELAAKYNDKVCNIQFRNKDKIKDWYVSKIIFENRKPVYIDSLNDDYMNCFLRCGIYRDSCYTCKYANMDRVGDFTLGDFFGVSPQVFTQSVYRNGISLMMINSEKGEAEFNVIKDKINYVERPIKEATKTNLNLVRPSIKPEYREMLLKEDDSSIHKKSMLYCKSTWKTKISSVISRTMLMRYFSGR